MSHSNPNQPDEVKLLERARQFDEEALAWIYETYHDAIYRYIYRHLGHVQTAQDLASDVFRRFLQALRNGGGPTQQLSAWLYRVAHNLFVDELRRRKYRDHQALDSVTGDVLEDADADPDNLIWTATTRGEVRGALLDLTEEQRQVIVLKFLQGLSNAEVADIMDKTVGAVKALQHRGITALREQLATSQEPEPVRLDQAAMAHSVA
jgi:RNA polymerase sigma-70 factor (ECF subfamily)